MSKYDFLHEKGWQGLAKKRLDLSDPETLIEAVKIRSSLMNQAPMSIRRDPFFFMEYCESYAGLLQYAKCSFSYNQLEKLGLHNYKTIGLLDWGSLKSNAERFQLLKRFMRAHASSSLNELELNGKVKLDQSHAEDLCKRFQPYIRFWLQADYEIWGNGTLMGKVLPLVPEDMLNEWLSDIPEKTRLWSCEIWIELIKRDPSLFKNSPWYAKGDFDVCYEAAIRDVRLIREWPSKYYTKEHLRDFIIKWSFAYHYLPEAERDLEITLLAVAAGDCKSIWRQIPMKYKKNPIFYEYLEEAKDFGAAP